MHLFTAAVPQWISILFVLVIPIPVILIAKMVKNGAINAHFSSQKSSQFFWRIIIFYTLFLSYASIMSFTGLYLVPSVPPRVVLFTTIPLMLFFILIVSKLNVYKPILNGIKLENLVSIHIFRLIGLFFIIINFYGAIPTAFAYMAGIGDITIALTSIFVAKAIKNQANNARSLTKIWNIFGILDIISVLIGAIITTKISLVTGSQGVIEISKFPFCFIPSFAAATILFLHSSIFRKLKMNGQHQ